MFDFSIEPLEQGYRFESTILAFGLNERELAILYECVKNKITSNKNGKQKMIRIYNTDEITDIYAIPNFLAFINMKKLNKEEQVELFEYWKECKEPLPSELQDLNQQDLDFNIYIFNCHDDIDYEIVGIYEDEMIFQNTEKLKLNILSIMKDNEGVGRNASESSIRIYRVLNMYKCLLKEGKISKERVDQLCYPDVISKRMFYRDIQILKEIEDGNLYYDRKRKSYFLNKIESI